MVTKMDAESRTVPIIYVSEPSEPDSLSVTGTPPVCYDPFLYSPYRCQVYDVDRRLLASRIMWQNFIKNMRKVIYEMRLSYEEIFNGLKPMADNGITTESVSQKLDYFDTQKQEGNEQSSVNHWRIRENFRMDNPITEDHTGARKLYLEYDMSQFKPEEITVKIIGKELSIFAKYDEKNDNHSSSMEFSRNYQLPEEVNPEMLTSKLNEAGKLTVEGPLSLPALKVKNKDRLLASQTF